MKTRFFIYEAYKDEKAVLAHKQTPHYLACVDKLEELMSEPRKTQLCRIVAGVAVLRWRCAYRAYGYGDVDFVGRVSAAPPGVVHASSSN